MNKLAIAAFAVSIISSSALAADKRSKAEIAAVAATPEKIASIVKIDDDPYAPAVMFSTVKFFEPKGGLFNFDYFDKFLRALVNRKTGETVYQIYLYNNYLGEWRFWERMAYIDENQPISIKYDVLSREVGRCERLGCWHSEHFTAELPERLVRKIASQFKSGEEVEWKFKTYIKDGQGIESPFLVSEFAGLLLAVDQYKSKMNIMPVIPAQPAQAPDPSHPPSDPAPPQNDPR